MDTNISRVQATEITYRAAHFTITAVRRKTPLSDRLLEVLLTTPERRDIFASLFDPAHPSQTAIAASVKVTQQAVSKLVSLLLDQGLIERIQGDSGATVYVDKYGLSELL